MGDPVAVEGIATNGVSPEVILHGVEAARVQGALVLQADAYAPVTAIWMDWGLASSDDIVIV